MEQIGATCEAFAASQAGEARADIVLADPPRTGLTPEVLAILQRAEDVIILSCNQVRPLTQIIDSFLDLRYIACRLCC